MNMGKRARVVAAATMILFGVAVAHAAAPEAWFRDGTPYWSWSPTWGNYVHSHGYFEVPTNATPTSASGQWSEDGGKTVKGTVGANWQQGWKDQNGIRYTFRNGFNFDVNPKVKTNVRVRLYYTYTVNGKIIPAISPWVSP